MFSNTWKTPGEHTGIYYNFAALSLNNNMLKRIYLSKALTCLKLYLYKTKDAFLSRRQIPLATLLYEQFMHHT